MKRTKKGFLEFIWPHIMIMVAIILIPLSARGADYDYDHKWTVLGKAGPNITVRAYNTKYVESIDYYDCSILEFDGYGRMYDFPPMEAVENPRNRVNGNAQPWDNYQTYNGTIRFSQGITYIGANLFPRGTQSKYASRIYFPDTVTEIGENALYQVTSNHITLYLGTYEQWQELQNKYKKTNEWFFERTTRFLKKKPTETDGIFDLRLNTIDVTDGGHLISTLHHAGAVGIINLKEDGNTIRADIDKDGKLDIGFIRDSSSSKVTIFQEEGVTQSQFEIQLNEEAKNSIISIGKTESSDYMYYYDPAVFLMDARKDLFEADYSLDDNTKKYTGKSVKALPVLTYGGKTLKEGKDYTVTYSGADQISAGKKVTMTITGIGYDFKGTLTKSFTIEAASIQDAVVSAADQVYTGSALMPAVTVKLGGTTLKADTDYTVSYKNNTAAGKATVTVTGKGNYTGTTSGTFQIRKSIAKAAVTAADQTYTGKALTPEVTVKLGSTTLKKNTDYTVTYKNNTAVGKATVTVTGAGNYTGTATGSFQIKEKETEKDPETEKEKTNSETEKPETEKPETEKPAGPSETEKSPAETEKTKSETEAPAAKPAYTRVKGEITPDKTKKLTTVNKGILKTAGNKDYAGATYSLLKAKGAAKSNTSIRLSWTKLKKADKYIVYGSKSGKTVKFKKLATVKANAYTQKKLKKGTSYKYIVVAVKGTRVVAVSRTMYVNTKGGKYGNAKSLKLNKKSVSLKRKKTFALKTTISYTLKKPPVLRKLSYESDNCAVATVTAQGKIKAVGKGTCRVYAYMQNGLAAVIKVTVK